MQSGPLSHPDRVAATLANVEEIRSHRGEHVIATPGSGSGDARIDLKLLQWKALRAAERCDAARTRLAAFDPALRPDLWAGTVQDGTARGFAAALEEAAALAPATEPPDQPPPASRLRGKELRRKQDLLVASGGARVRFTRRDGLLFVQRKKDVHSANCLRFEARADHGTLDAFGGAEGERPRIYSAQFLQPVAYDKDAGHSRLELTGRIGRGRVGWNLSIELSGNEDDDSLQLAITIDNRMRDWRLRARFLGIPPALIRHECADVREIVANDARGFTAFTLVRACGTLLVDGKPVAVPSAQCPGSHTHRFVLG